MKKTFKLIILLVLTCSLHAQSSWITQITNNESATGSKLVQTQDGGFVMLLNHVDTMRINAYWTAKNRFVKTDSVGNILINKNFVLKDSTSIYIGDFIELQTGDFICGGSVYEVTSSTRYNLLFKLNNVGDTIWTKMFEPNGWHFSQIVELTNSFCVIQRGDSIGFLHKYDFDGNLIEVNYNDTIVTTTYNIQDMMGRLDSDKLFYRSDSDVSGKFLYKVIDTLYNVLSTKYISDTYSVYATQPDGSIGLYNQGETPWPPLDLYRINIQLDSVWYYPASTYTTGFGGAGEDQIATGISTTNDGGYVLSGFITNGLVQNPYLIKVDEFGNNEWDQVYWAVVVANNDVIQTSDGGYVMFQRESYGDGGFGGNLWLVKANSEGIVTATNEYLKNTLTTKVYPNPVNDKLIVDFEKIEDNYLFKIYNIEGKQVVEQQFNSLHNVVDVNQLPNGIYYYKIIAPNQEILTGKISIAK